MTRIKLLSVVIAILLLTPYLSAGTKTKFFLTVGSGTKIKKSTTSYGWQSSSPVVSLDEGGSINTSFDLAAHITGGIEFSLSESLSLILSATYMKPGSTILSHYILNGEWHDGDKFSTNLRQWKSDSVNNSSQLPVSLSVAYHTPISPSMSVYLKAGITCMFINADFRSAIGYADAIETNSQYLVDWFILGVKAKENTVSIGGNVGIELEKRLSLKTAAFVGVEYLFMKKKSIRWEVIPFNSIIGEEKQLVLEKMPDIHGNKPINLNLNPSLFRFYIGFKFSL